MGNTNGKPGIYTNNEVKGLSESDHEKLVEHVLKHVQKETCDLLKANPNAKIQEVRDKVKAKSKPFYDSLPKS